MKALSNKKRTSFMLLSMIALLSTLFVGCASQPVNNAVNENHSPVTITMYNWGVISDDEFQKLFVEPVQKKYPYITLDQVKRGPGNNPDQLVASGNFPDLIVTNNDALDVFNQVSALTDISSLVKKYNIELTAFEPAEIERSKFNNQLVGLPFFMASNALFYNKDIFDKFGIAYPKDGMSWADMLDLTKKLTKQADGVQFRGYDPQSIYTLNSSLPNVLVDAKTNQASINTDQWKQVISLYKDIITIPGNQQTGTAFNDVAKGFLTNHTVAMVTGDFTSFMKDAQFNWDIAESPSFDGYPNTGGGGQTLVLAPSASTKDPDDVMKIIQVLTSSEVQTAMTKMKAERPALKDPKIQASFGADLSFVQGKNIKAIFKSGPSALIPSSTYSRDVRSIFEAHLQEYFKGQKDINSALTAAEDEMNKKIAQLKAQQ